MARRKKRKSYQDEEDFLPQLNPETKRGIIVIILFIIAVVSFLSFMDSAGVAGYYINIGLSMVFGSLKYLFAIALFGISYVLVRPSKYTTGWYNFVGIALLLLGLCGILHSFQISLENSFHAVTQGAGGGFFGFIASYPLQLYFGSMATILILIAIVLGGVLLTFHISLHSIFDKKALAGKLAHLKNPEKHLGEDEYEERDEETEEDEEAAPAFSFTRSKLKPGETAAPTIKSKKIKTDLPITLLDKKFEKPRSGDVGLAKERIQKTLENFNIPVEMGDISVGPTVTQYTLKPSDGVKLSKIVALNNDLALALAAHPIRIEAPIPGKSLVGIEVPNQKIATIHLRELLETQAFKKRQSNLTMTIGKDVAGKCWTANLKKMPHLLLAGATGSGKSMCLQAMLIAFLYQNNPETLRLILIDPKRVELTAYNGIPHLLTPVITDVTKTINALRWSITEMDRRFDVLAKSHKRNIDSYNLTATEKLPYIVIMIDELADLMVAAAAEVEACIIRLTQMARAVGIHLVVATQRPSVDVITGLIKANIPTRIAFSVASLVDSRTILDSAGAEKLMGKGDMLYMSPQTSKPKRLQGSYVSEAEIKRVAKFLKDLSGEPEYQEEILEKQSTPSNFDFSSGSRGGADEDALLPDAKEVIVQAGKASASLLQRRLRVGYARAARLIDLLEDQGIVGPADGAKPRDVLISSLEELSSSQVFQDTAQKEPPTPSDVIPTEMEGSTWKEEVEDEVPRLDPSDLARDDIDENEKLLAELEKDSL